MPSGIPANQPPKHYKIGEVMRYSGLSRQTLHNYTMLGLITPVTRTESGHRLYGADVFNLPPVGPIAPANENFTTFWNNFVKLGLDVDTVANAHGRIGTGDELRARAQKRVASN